jgi:pSer/pThr/pTyr-binding forkhead associated (FHA) protein
MKLLFPGGEHAPVELANGTTTIGSGSDCGIVLHGEGVAERHCAITLEAGGATLRPLDAVAPTVLNGRQVNTDSVIADGDLLVLGRVGCSINSSERRASPKPAAPSVAPVEPDNDGRTRVRATLPKFMLRGVSGATLGKTFAVTDNAVIGRQPDCDIPIAAEEVSRHHVRLKITPDGLHVEDMGSANGTFINGARVQSGLLKPGEELRLDTIRFQLVTPGMDARQQSASVRPDSKQAATPVADGGSGALWIAVGAVVVAAIAFAALRYAGII